MDNAFNVTSVRATHDTLPSGKIRSDPKTIWKDFDALCQAFALSRIRRYGIRGKRYSRSEDKYDLTDRIFYFVLQGTKNMDYGRVLANIAAVDLLR